MKRLPAGEEDDVVAHEEGATMGFLDHLEELRWTLFKCAAAFFTAVIVVGIFLKSASNFLNAPYEKASLAHGVEGSLFMTSPVGVFTVILQICFIGGFGLALPAILYFLARFIAPALKKDEIKMLLPSCAAAFVLFAGGLAFAYLWIVPEALGFSIRLNKILGYEIMWTGDRYYSLLVWTMLGMGFCFQFPLVVYILVYLRIVSTEILAKARRYMIVVFFFMGALLTPTWDPITQAMVALPMWFLYELSVFLARRVEKRRIAEIEEELSYDEDDRMD